NPAATVISPRVGGGLGWTRARVDQKRNDKRRPSSATQASSLSSVHRSELTVDLGALRRNVRTLVRVLDGAELWAVVKADGYGHGAADVAGAALGSGASALCVATVPEGLALRREFPGVRILVMGPVAASREVAQARD